MRNLVSNAAAAAGLATILWLTCIGLSLAAAPARGSGKGEVDFKLQGEYMGDAAEQKLGAQVVALGDGAFLASFLPGGLPGEGPADPKPRVEVKGRREGQRAVFAGAGIEAAADGETLNGTVEGKKFSLKKVRRESPAAGAKPPAGAKVLFDKGGPTDAWDGAKVNDEGYLLAGAVTKDAYRDFTMHVEFRIPFRAASTDQSRGNSGVYVQRRYEVQILDSFGMPAVFNGCGSLYRQRPPDVNMCYPPGAWQTYDIEFTAARWDESGAKKVKNAVITVKHNGVTIHDRVELTNKTGAGQPEGPQPLPILLQEHGSPVAFRNVWIVER